MANQSYKTMSFKLAPQGTSVLTEITCALTSAALNHVQNLLDDTTLCDDQTSMQPVNTGAVIPLAGLINTTSNTAFGGSVTSVQASTRRWQYYNGLSYFNGYAWVGNYQQSGQVGQLQVFSAELTVEGAVNKTSVAL